MARYLLPTLKTYEEASKHEAQVVPIRRRTPECKPLGDRRDTGLTIKKLPDESIVAKCYRSDLIRWYPDGRIFITNGGYASQTSHDFISRLLHGRGWFCSAHDGKTWMASGGDHKVYPLAKEGQFFTWDPKGQHLVAETPNYPVTHVINKPAMRAARKEIAPFIKYFNNMMKLTQWASMEGKLTYLGTDVVVHRVMVNGDAEEWGRALLWLAQHGTRQQYLRERDPVTGAYTHSYRRYVSKSVIQDRITRILLAAHRSKVLTKRTHTHGGWVKDAYKDYADE